MALILNKPSVKNVTSDTTSAHEVARFIADGDKRPSKGRAISRTLPTESVVY